MSEKQAPLGDPEIAVEILKLRVAELEQAIRRLAYQDATLSVQGGNVTVTMDATLTDEERDALEFVVETGRVATHYDETTLRNLFERTK
jgi:predicted metal-dependent phosphoesterase TrpH